MKRQHPENPDLFWCPKCQTYKAREEFNNNKNRAFGINGWCRLCTNEKIKQHRMKNGRDSHKEYLRMRELHPSYCADYQKKWRGKNIQVIREYRTEWNDKNRNRINEMARDKYRENTEYFLDKARRFRTANIEKVKKREHLRLESLPDGYIKTQLRVLDIPITPETIELKRQQIIMKRTLKQFKDWRKEHESVNQDVAAE